MAQIQEFDHSPSNPSSPLFNGMEVYIPPYQAKTKPSQVFFIGANGDATLAPNGRLIITEGVSGQAFFNTKSYQWTRIHAGSFRRTPSAVDTQKVATVTLNTPDYVNTNPNGVTEISTFYFDKRYTVPQRGSYIIESPASSAQTLGQRAQRLVAKINADPNALVTASSPTSGSDAVQSVITLTAKKGGLNITINAGMGTTGVVTVTTPYAEEFGTSKYITDQGYSTADSNKSGKTFQAVDFKVDVPVSLAGHGTFQGREVGNNAYGFEEKTIRIFFENGAGDAKFTAFNTLVQGKFATASSYYAKATDLTAPQ